MQIPFFSASLQQMEGAQLLGLLAMTPSSDRALKGVTATACSAAAFFLQIQSKRLAMCQADASLDQGQTAKQSRRGECPPH